MPTYQSTGIVIGRTNFGEADRVIRFITLEHGKLSAVARGVRKIKSRAAGHLELFGEVNLMLAQGRNLDVITSARLVWYPHQLTAAYDRLGLAFAMATAIDRLTEPGQPMPQLYMMVREALVCLEQGADAVLLELWFKLRLLNLLGYQPALGACVVCGTHDPGLGYLFSAERGGIVCQNDTNPGDQPISISAIKLWRLLAEHPYASIDQIGDAPMLAIETLPACNGFYEYHVGRSFQPGIV